MLTCMPGVVSSYWSIWDLGRSVWTKRRKSIEIYGHPPNAYQGDGHCHTATVEGKEVSVSACEDVEFNGYPPASKEEEKSLQTYPDAAR